MKYGVYAPTDRIMRVRKSAGFCAIAREPKGSYRKVRADLLRPVSEAQGSTEFRMRD